MSLALRDHIIDILFEDLIYDAAESENAALVAACEKVTDFALKCEIDEAAHNFAMVKAEAAFLAGLQCGQNVLRLACERA